MRKCGLGPARLQPCGKYTEGWIQCNVGLNVATKRPSAGTGQSTIRAPSEEILEFLESVTITFARWHLILMENKTLGMFKMEIFTVENSLYSRGIKSCIMIGEMTNLHFTWKTVSHREAFTQLWERFLLLTLLGRNHKFSEHSWSLPRDCRAWCPCGWCGSCEGTWRPGGSDKGTPWCGRRWGAADWRWSCEGRSASTRLWGRFLEKSRCGEAEIKQKLDISRLGWYVCLNDIEVCQLIPVSMFICLGTSGSKRLCALVFRLSYFPVSGWVFNIKCDKQENPCIINLGITAQIQCLKFGN